MASSMEMSDQPLESNPPVKAQELTEQFRVKGMKSEFIRVILFSVTALAFTPLMLRLGVDGILNRPPFGDLENPRGPFWVGLYFVLFSIVWVVLVVSRLITTWQLSHIHCHTISIGDSSLVARSLWRTFRTELSDISHVDCTNFRAVMKFEELNMLDADSPMLKIVHSTGTIHIPVFPDYVAFLAALAAWRPDLPIHVIPSPEAAK